MLNAAAIAGAILSLVPGLDPIRAERHAAIIAEVARDEAEAGALAVTGAHESGFLRGFELCRFRGDGGDGIYGLGEGYREAACADPVTQARTAAKALRDKGWPNARRAFRGYLGAPTDRWPEARSRLALWVVVTENIKCACSVGAFRTTP